MCQHLSREGCTPGQTPNLSQGILPPKNVFLEGLGKHFVGHCSLHLLLGLEEERPFVGDSRLWGAPRPRVKLTLVLPHPQPRPAFLAQQTRLRATLSTSCLTDCVCLQRQGVDVIFQTSDQCVYILGARKFFQINTA